MTGDPNVAAAASLLADRARAAMLCALLGGRALPAGELAALAGITAQTASSHLAKLEAAGFVAVERNGRHRYYRIANPNVAHVVETLATLAPATPVRSLNQSLGAGALREARSCYDHLAGALALRVCDALENCGYVMRAGEGFEATATGLTFFTQLGLDMPRIVQSRRTFARACLDWSERRHHIAGALGAAMLDRFLRAQWLTRVSGSRALRLTAKGQTALHTYFGDAS